MRHIPLPPHLHTATFSLLMVGLMIATSGCDGEADKGNPPDIADDTGDPSCGGTVPVLTTLTLSDGSIFDEDQGRDVPSIKLTVDAEDEDADLDRIHFRFWFDESEDGVVDTTGAPSSEVKNISFDSAEPCNVPLASFTLNVELGGLLDYNNRYEFAAQINDSNGLASNIIVAAGFTAKEDGSPGDGETD